MFASTAKFINTFSLWDSKFQHLTLEKPSTSLAGCQAKNPKFRRKSFSPFRFLSPKRMNLTFYFPTYWLYTLYAFFQGLVDAKTWFAYFDIQQLSVHGWSALFRHSSTRFWRMEFENRIRSTERFGYIRVSGRCPLYLKIPNPKPRSEMENLLRRLKIPFFLLSTAV